MERSFTPRALGEIAIRCADLPKMVAFYEGILGLTRMSGDYGAHIVFFRIGEGFQGHTTVLALFDEDSAPVTGPQSSLHHIALSLPYAEQDAVVAWYEANGLDYSIQTFPWIGWRGIFTKDPEGNTVELVAHHAALSAPS